MIIDFILKDLQSLGLDDLKTARVTPDGGFTWFVEINKQTDSVFLKKIEKLPNDLNAEISRNREIGQKEEFENYLFSIKQTIDIIISCLYSNREEPLKRMVLEKIFELQELLMKIPEYKTIYKKGHTSPSGNEKIVWKKQVNQLVDFYLRQLEQGYIETEPENLKLFLINNFTWKGKSLVESSMDTYFDPNKKFEKLPKDKKQMNPKDLLQDS